MRLAALPALGLPLASVLALGLLLVAASGGEASADARDAGLVADARSGEGGSPASADRRDGGADGGFTITRTPPDPPPLAERQQWVFDLRFDRGDIYLLEIHKVDMGEPHTTARVIGRFALELFEGPTLIERVRFDFPMLGADELPGAASASGWKTPARFGPKLRTRIGVLFPATKRGTKLTLWDRATNVRLPLPWPPTEGPQGAPAAAAPDGGAKP